MAERRAIESIDYLLDKSEPSNIDSGAEAPSDSGTLLRAFAALRVLQAASVLEQAEDEGDHGVLTSEIDEQVQMGSETIAIVKSLVSAGFLKVLEHRPLDDDKVELTRKAKEMLGSGDNFSLFKELDTA